MQLNQKSRGSIQKLDNVYRYPSALVGLHSPIVEFILHGIDSPFPTPTDGTTTYTSDDCTRLDTAVVVRRRVANVAAMG